MTYVAPPRRAAQLPTLPIPEPTIGAALGFTLASHVGQNPDGTWSSTPQGQTSSQRARIYKDEDPRPSRTLRQGPSRPLTSQVGEDLPTVADVLNDSSTPGNECTAMVDDSTTPQLKGKKRKVDDDDDNFALPATNAGSQIQREEVLASKGTRAPKRRATASRNNGHEPYHRNMQEDKPAPYGQPPVWADKRQSLCETLPYYRAYQSGPYISSGIIRGFLVDKEVGPRDKFQEEIMISRW